MLQRHHEDTLSVEPRLRRAARLGLPRLLHTIAGTGLARRTVVAADSHLRRGVARGALQLRHEWPQPRLQPRHRLLHRSVARPEAPARSARPEGRSRVVPAREALLQAITAGLPRPRRLQSAPTASPAAHLAPRPRVISRALPPRRALPVRRVVPRRTAPCVHRPLLTRPRRTRRCTRREAPAVRAVGAGPYPRRHLLDLETPALRPAMPRRAAIPRRAVAAVAEVGPWLHGCVRVVMTAAAQLA